MQITLNILAPDISRQASPRSSGNQHIVQRLTTTGSVQDPKQSSATASCSVAGQSACSLLPNNVKTAITISRNYLRHLFRDSHYNRHALHAKRSRLCFQRPHRSTFQTSALQLLQMFCVVELFVRLSFVAMFAAALARIDVSLRWDSANVSGSVTSRARASPRYHRFGCWGIFIPFLSNRLALPLATGIWASWIAI